MKFGELQKEISKASLSVTADLSNDFKAIILGGAAKISTIFSK